MKCLSIQQPWAQLILGNAPDNYMTKHGPKRVENRTWRTDYRGKIVIHAGKKFDMDAMYDLYDGERKECFHLGALLGFADVVGCRTDSPSPWAVRGCWHWELANVVCFTTPLPAMGALGLFDVPDVVVNRELIIALDKMAKDSSLVVEWPPRALEEKVPRKTKEKRVPVVIQDDLPGLGLGRIDG